jgi:hypothetical protein
MTATPATFEFDVSLDDLLYAEGAAGLNDILDERMSNDPLGRFEGKIATDISYQPVLVTPGDNGLITIIATFTPEALDGADEDEEGDED